MSSAPPEPASSVVITVVKSLPDNWLNSNPLQVKSRLSIPLSSTAPATGLFQSEACGLGWSFTGTYESVKFESVERVAKKRYPYTFKDSTVQKCRCKVSLSLHPGAIRGMPFGDLHVKASLSEIPLGDLTQGNLSVYESFSFDVTVALNVPAGCIPIPIAPRRTIESEIMEVVTASLDGEFPIDIKVLKGWSAFIDKYVMESDGVDIDRDDNNYGVSCDYPFEDDSDLESDGEPEVLGLDSVDQVDGEHSSRHLPEGSDMIIDATATGYAYSSGLEGSPVECFADEALSDLKQTTSIHEISGELHQTTSAGDRTRDWNPSRPARSGSVKPIKDVAYTTFKSLIAWIYTGKIAFKPLKSLGSLERDPSACSPKSMYRLATRAGLDQLKELAFDDLRSQLTEENIVRELFSTFSRDNSEVLEMELTVMLEYFSTTRVRAEWENMIDVVFDGRMPHGVRVIKRVTRRLASSEKR
ncbi:hypothetical protein IW262DRAFT_1559198 [Armillaria fumosa]|nr:hypothetical protein IW262DRAFT_1559198 [Armillaria fumosa]